MKTIKAMIRITRNAIFINEVEIESEKQQRPKDGEFWFVKTNIGRSFVFIAKKGEHLTSMYLCYNHNLDMCHFDERVIVCSDRIISELRPATHQEINLIYNKLEKKGKTWNPQTKTLEYIPKSKQPTEGKAAIFWNKNKKEAVVGLYNGSFTLPFSYLNPFPDQSRFHVCRSNSVSYLNAIPLESLEQYLEFVNS